LAVKPCTLPASSTILCSQLDEKFEGKNLAEECVEDMDWWSAAVDTEKQASL